MRVSAALMRACVVLLAQFGTAGQGFLLQCIQLYLEFRHLITGIRRELDLGAQWQVDQGGQVDLALGHGFLHDPQACFEAVLHRAGHGFVQGQRAAERFLILEHGRQILLRALLADAAVEAHQNIALVEVLAIAERHFDDAARQHPAYLTLAGLGSDGRQ